jgi:hypothetical protein
MHLVVHGSLSTRVIHPSLTFISVVLELLLLFCDRPQCCGCRNQVPPQVPDNGHVQTFVPFEHICIMHAKHYSVHCTLIVHISLFCAWELLRMVESYCVGQKYFCKRYMLRSFS